jgi:hypothetical protein
MTAVEIISPKLGDRIIDARAKTSAGFDECMIEDVEVHGTSISFQISSASKQRGFLIRCRGLDSARRYSVRWNDGEARTVSGDQLIENGLEAGSLGKP